MFLKLLEGFARTGRLIHLERAGGRMPDTRGLVQQASGALILLEVVGPRASFDGLRIVRMEDVTLVRWDTDTLVAWTEALGDQLRPRPVDLRLDALEAAIQSAAERFGLVTLCHEDASGCETLTVRDVTLMDGMVTGERITPEGTADGRVAVPTARITRVDLDGSYEAALSRILGVQHRGEPGTSPPREAVPAANPSELDTLVTGID